MTRPLSHTPAFRGLREALLVKGDRWPVCERCGEPVEPSGWTVHRKQLCPGERGRETRATRE